MLSELENIVNLEKSINAVNRKSVDIKLYKFQNEVFVDDSKIRIVAAGRRVGKTYLACVIAAHHLLSGNNRKVLIVSRTLDQGKSAVWETLHEIIPREYIRKTTKIPLVMYLVNNRKIIFKSGDDPDSMRGISPSPTLIVCDEFAYFKDGIWANVLSPMLADVKAKPKAVIISTPNGASGEFYDLYRRGIVGIDGNPVTPGYRSWQFKAEDVRLDMVEEIAAFKRDNNEKVYLTEFCASFESTGYLVFNNFDYNRNVINRNKIPAINKNEVIRIGIDFNVGIQASCIFVIRNGIMYFFNEYYGDYNTEELAKRIKKDYADHRVIAYPDVSGKARKTSAGHGVTDFSILQKYKIEVCGGSKQPKITDSVSVVNSLLCSADGTSRIFISDACKLTIESLSKTRWQVNANESNLDNAVIDKSGKIEHWSDAIRYACWALFPPYNKVTMIRPNHGFF